MNETIKISYAERGGQLVHISELETGGFKPDCLCLECRQALVARIGRIRQPHFAHPPGVPPCSSETILHLLGKWFVMQHIERALQEQEPLLICWRCPSCEEDHVENLLECITRSAVEVQFGPVRPDITLYRQDGHPTAAVEIVVSHEPEPAALDFYLDQEVLVWMVQLATEDDVEIIRKWKAPLRVTPANDYCRQPRCPKCHEHMQNRYLWIESVPCWNCDRQMRAALVGYGYAQKIAGPEAFTAAEMSYTKQAGVIIEQRYHRQAQECCAVNVCAYCKSHIGPLHIGKYVRFIGRNIGQVSLSIGCKRCGASQPTTSGDLEVLPSLPAAPSSDVAPANLTRPCWQCGDRLKPRFLFLYEGRVPVIMYGRQRGYVVGPTKFSQHERQMAIKHGASDLREQRFSFYRCCGRMLEQARVQPVGFFALGCRRCLSIEPLDPKSDAY